MDWTPSAEIPSGSGELLLERKRERRYRGSVAPLILAAKREREEREKEIREVLREVRRKMSEDYLREVREKEMPCGSGLQRPQ